MKNLVLVFLIGVGCCLAAEGPIANKSALLVFTGQQLNITFPDPMTTAAPPSNKSDDLSSVNARTMERLAKEAGSQSGIYHILLPDGRLQRVEYTAAPVAPSGGQQDAPAAFATGRQADPAPVVMPGPRSIYFVQVPGDRIQTLMGPQSPMGLEPRSNQGSASADPSATQAADGGQAPSAQMPPPPPASRDFLPVVVLSAGQLASDPSYRPLQYQPSDGNGVQPQSQAAERDGRALQTPGDQQPPTGYLASVQLTEVKPISGPVYTYNPPSLVRILRRALPLES